MSKKHREILKILHNMNLHEIADYVESLENDKEFLRQKLNEAAITIGPCDHGIPYLNSCSQCGRHPLGNR